MEVRLFATLRPIVGGPTVQLKTEPGASVRTLLDEMISRYPAMQKELFDGEGRLHNNIHVFINGRDVRYLGGLDIAIPEGANIRIFPPVGGGADTGTPALSEQAENPEGVFDYYSVPLWMMRGYLEQLGGREVGENSFQGDGWQATLSAAPWRHIGSLRVGGTRAAFTGAPDALEAFYLELHKKTMRGGG
jgi:molybdopterin synthase sulfur carrier subunit